MPAIFLHNVTIKEAAASLAARAVAVRNGAASALTKAAFDPQAMLGSVKQWGAHGLEGAKNWWGGLNETARNAITRGGIGAGIGALGGAGIDAMSDDPHHHYFNSALTGALAGGAIGAGGSLVMDKGVQPALAKPKREFDPNTDMAEPGHLEKTVRNLAQPVLHPQEHLTAATAGLATPLAKMTVVDPLDRMRVNRENAKIDTAKQTMRENIAKDPVAIRDSLTRFAQPDAKSRAPAAMQARTERELVRGLPDEHLMNTVNMVRDGKLPESRFNMLDPAVQASLGATGGGTTVSSPRVPAPRSWADTLLRRPVKTIPGDPHVSFNHPDTVNYGGMRPHTFGNDFVNPLMAEREAAHAFSPRATPMGRGKRWSIAGLLGLLGASQVGNDPRSLESLQQEDTFRAANPEQHAGFQATQNRGF